MDTGRSCRTYTLHPFPWEWLRRDNHSLQRRRTSVVQSMACSRLSQSSYLVWTHPMAQALQHALTTRPHPHLAFWFHPNPPRKNLPNPRNACSAATTSSALRELSWSERSDDLSPRYHNHLHVLANTPFLDFYLQRQHTASSQEPQGERVLHGGRGAGRRAWGLALQIP